MKQAGMKLRLLLMGSMALLWLICLGVIGEYIGKIYLESKHRPRYIISDATPNFGEIKEDAQ